MLLLNLRAELKNKWIVTYVYIYIERERDALTSEMNHYDIWLKNFLANILFKTGCQCVYLKEIKV